MRTHKELLQARRPSGPIHEHLHLFEQMRRLFDDLDPDFGSADLQRRVGRMPRVDLIDRGEELQLYAELPGFRDEDIEVTLERDQLILRGQRTTEVPQGYQVRRRERGDMSFARTLTLPCRVDPERVNAELSNGVLQVTLPKAAEERPRSIPVKVG